MRRWDLSRVTGVLRACALAGAASWAFCACSSGHGSATPTTSSVPPAGQYKTLLDAGIYLLGHGNANAAQQLFEQAIQSNPRSPIGYYDLGVVFQQDGNAAGALHQFQLAVAMDASYVPALYNEAVLLAGTNPAQAMRLYERVINIQPNSPTALLNLGLLQAAANQHRQAVLSLRRAVHLDPSLASRIPAPLRAEVSAS